MENSLVVRPYAVQYKTLNTEEIEEIVELAYTAEDAITQARVRGVGHGVAVVVLAVGPYVATEEEPSKEDESPN